MGIVERQQKQQKLPQRENLKEFCPFKIANGRGMHFPIQNRICHHLQAGGQLLVNHKHITGQPVQDPEYLTSVLMFKDWVKHLPMG